MAKKTTKRSVKKKVSPKGKGTKKAAAKKVSKAKPKASKPKQHASTGLSRAHRENIRKHIIFMSELVEQAVDSAVLAIVERSTEISKDVVSQDEEINNMEYIIDQMCLEILESDSPKGRNLRYISAIMKINNDLERMGNLAVNISEENLHLVQKHSVLRTELPLAQMLEDTSLMVRESIDALFSGDIKMAYDVIKQDDAVDKRCDEIIHSIIGEMQKDPKKADAGTFLILAVVSIERIADKATHIAEEVIYMETGRFPNHILHSHDSAHY